MQRLGRDPAEFYKAEIEALEEELARNQVIVAMGGGRARAEAKKKVMDYTIQLALIWDKLLPYCYPKLGSQQTAVTHDVNIRHTDEPLSETDAWIAGVLGDGEDGATEEPGPH